jgi:hypothetical protein
MYHYGSGVTEDTAEAAKWFAEALKQYRKAAAQGDARAKYKLGEMYLAGEGVTQDFTEALRWYREAAEQGNADAMYKLSCEDRPPPAKSCMRRARTSRRRQVSRLMMPISPKRCCPARVAALLQEKPTQRWDAALAEII